MHSYTAIPASAYQQQLDLPTLIAALQIAIMEYVAISEGRDPSQYAEYNLDEIKNNPNLNPSRIADIIKISEICNVAIRNKRTPFDLAEIINVYFKHLIQTGVNFWGYTLFSGSSRLRERINAVTHTLYPILTLEDEEQEFLKSHATLIPTQTPSDDPAELKHQVTQLKHLLVTTQEQTDQLQASLQQSQQLNRKLALKLKQTTEEAKQTEVKLNESKQESTQLKKDLAKEKSLTHSLRNTVAQQSQNIQFLSQHLEEMHENTESQSNYVPPQHTPTNLKNSRR